MRYPLRMLVCCALTASTWCARPESIRDHQKDSEVSVSLSDCDEGCLPPSEEELAPEDEIEVGSDAVGSVAEVLNSKNPPKSWTYSWISDPDPQKKDPLKCSRGKSPIHPRQCRRVLNKNIGDKTKYSVEVIQRTDDRAKTFPPGCSLSGRTMYFNKLGNSTAKRNDVRLVCSFNMKNDAEEMAELVSRERRRNYRQKLPLCPSIRASTAAFKHSQDMALRDYFSHTAEDPAPNGKSPKQRLIAEGFPWGASGENIAYSSYAKDDILNYVFELWNASPGHRRTMMYLKFENLGFAYYEQREWSERKYFTQMFGRVTDSKPDANECD